MTVLKIVPESSPPAASAALLRERIQQLRAETRNLVIEHVERLTAALLDTQQIADEIAVGGDVYPPGVRDLASRLREDAAAKAQTLNAIMARV